MTGTVAIPDMPRRASHRQLPRPMDAPMRSAVRVEEEFARWIRPPADFGPSAAFHDPTTIRIGGEKENEDDLRRQERAR